VTDPAVLDFHHRQRETKLMDIGDMITHGYGKKKLCEEMEKCDVLCSNCHRKEHRKRESAGALRAWVNDFKRSADGCSRCPEADFRALVFTTTVIQNELRLRS
jgi:acetate kinase